MENQKNNDFDNSNIFDELSKDIDLEKSFNDIKKEKEKDKFYYIGLASSIFKTFNIFLGIGVFLTIGYLYIQGGQLNSNLPYLNPICGVFLGDASKSIEGNCSSITALNIDIQNDINKEKNNYYKKVVEMLPNLYSMNNILKSKEISFLLDKTENRLKVFNILSEFDRLKNNFDTYDTDRIKCENVSINSSNILNLSCNAYSSFWDEESIRGSSEDEKISGTSRAVAVSFLNYLQTEPNNFILLNKQKSFTLGENSEDGLYTNVTNFSLELQYNGNNLSF